MSWPVGRMLKCGATNPLPPSPVRVPAPPWPPKAQATDWTSAVTFVPSRLPNNLRSRRRRFRRAVRSCAAAAARSCAVRLDRAGCDRSSVNRRRRCRRCLRRRCRRSRRRRRSPPSPAAPRLTAALTVIVAPSARNPWQGLCRAAEAGAADAAGAAGIVHPGAADSAGTQDDVAGHRRASHPGSAPSPVREREYGIAARAVAALNRAGAALSLGENAE